MRPPDAGVHAFKIEGISVRGWLFREHPTNPYMSLDPVLYHPALCRAHPTLECGCAVRGDLVHTPRCTVYPKSGLIRVDGRLIALVLQAFGAGYVRRMMHAINRGDAHVSGLYRLGDMVCISVSNPIVTSLGNIQPVWWSGEICDWHVLKVQRWWKARRVRALGLRMALCMGTHARLGKDSPLLGVHVDVLRALCRANAGTRWGMP